MYAVFKSNSVHCLTAESIAFCSFKTEQVDFLFDVVSLFKLVLTRFRTPKWLYNLKYNFKLCAWEDRERLIHFSSKESHFFERNDLGSYRSAAILKAYAYCLYYKQKYNELFKIVSENNFPAVIHFSLILKILIPFLARSWWIDKFMVCD